MFRKIAVIFITLVIGALFAGYFYHVGTYAASFSQKATCGGINVQILDKSVNRFIEEPEVEMMVRDSVMGVGLDKINCHTLEQYLTRSSVINTAQCYVTDIDGMMHVEITQRVPVVRFQSANGGYLCDSSGFILPLRRSMILDLPVISGQIPVQVEPGFRGYPENIDWIRTMIAFASTIQENPYWREEVEQINVGEGGNISLYTRSRSEVFMIGQPTGIESKLRKMGAYYSTIAPRDSLHYKTVNLKYKNQIICK